MKLIDCVIIPARGGSKRIKHKNMQSFCGVPMLGRSIKTAQMVSDCVIVSSDDLEILEFAKLQGAYPLLRDKTLACDMTPTLPVITHSILPFLDNEAKDFMVDRAKNFSTNSLLKDSKLKDKTESKKVDSKLKAHNKEELQYAAYNDINAKIPLISLESKVLCLYATAMFATQDDIIRASCMLDENLGAAYIVSIIEAAKVFRSFTCTDSRFLEFMFPQFMDTRSQDLPKAFFDAGQFYLGRANSFLEQIPLLGQKSMGLTLEYAHDIDTMLDLKIAESLFTNIKGII